MSSDSTSLVIILVCLVLSAYFSATETAFSTMSHARMKTMADKGDKSAALALQLADNYDTLLSAILIGNNLVNILLSSVATLLFVKFLGEQTGASVATASVTVVVLIFGEISPKSIAKESPEKFAMFFRTVYPCLDGAFKTIYLDVRSMEKAACQTVQQAFG